MHSFQYDKKGNRLNLKDLHNPQTDDAKLAHLHKHFAEHPSRGLTPSKLAGILRRAEEGDLIAQCELAEDMEEKDGHLFAELQKRRLCLQGVDWQIKPPRNATPAEVKDTEMLQEHIEDMTFLDDLIFDMSDAILKGFSNNEIKWQQEENLWLPVSTDFKDPSWFTLHPDNRDEMRLRDNSVYGAELQTFGWVKHVHKTKSGYLSRNGLARVLAWPYLFKNYGVRDIAEFLEIYGLPLRLGKYPTGASDTEKNTLLRAVMSIGHNAGGVIPKGMDIEFQEAAKGSHQPFEFVVSLMEKTMSKAILGGTLTSQADGKSSTNALGNVHNEVRQELRDSDLKQIAFTLTTDVIFPMYFLNGKSYRKPSRCPKFEFDITEAEDIHSFSTALPPLVDVGLKIPTQWVQDKLQIPMPEKGEEVLARSQPTVTPVENEPAPESDTDQEKEPEEDKSESIDALKKIAMLKQKSEQHAKDKENNQDEIDDLSHQTLLKMSPILKGFNDEIEALVNSADSLEDLQEQLANKDLSVDEVSEVLQQALVIGELGGWFEVDEESQSEGN